MEKGVKASVQAIKEIYRHDNIEGIILEVSDAFNSLNQQTGLYFI